MADAAIEAGEQGGGFGSDERGCEMGTGKIANGVEGVPISLDDDFDFVLEASSGNGGAEIARDAAEFGENVLGKMLKIFWQLRLGGASGPAAQDCSGWRCKGRS